MSAPADEPEGITTTSPGHEFQTRVEHNEEKAPHTAGSKTTEAAEPYSSFTTAQKAYISYAASFSAMFSGLSSFIYYPAITALSRSLAVSIEMINLSITSYQLVSGIAPSIMGDMADQTGRRPASLTAFSLYFVANLGLALQNNYVALMLLRCLQSVGASGKLVSPVVIYDSISSLLKTHI